MAKEASATPESNGESAATGWWDKIKAMFKKAKDSEAAEKAGDVAEKVWDKTKDVADKAWDKTKDVAGDVKEKIDERRDADKDEKDDEGAK